MASNWVSRGGGRKSAQPALSGGTWEGPGSTGSVGTTDWPATTSPTSATISERSTWVGAGKGRAGGQPVISSGDLMGGQRSSQSTEAWRNNSGGGTEHVGDPEGAFIFALEIDGIEVAQFLECAGIKSSTQVFELEEGGMNHRVHKLPGQSRWENLTLRYGVTGDISLLQWRDEILQDQFSQSSRRSGAIVMKNNQMEVVRKYNFIDAWPVAYEGPSFSAAHAEVAVEMIELAHHGIWVSSN
jgi:phage tail-like protein